MSIVAVNELFEGREAQENEKGQRFYTRVFQVVTDDPNDGPLTAARATGVPRRGALYSAGNEVDLAARVRRITPSQNPESPRLWEIRIEYDTVREEQDENPLNRPYEVNWDFAQFTRPVWRDIFGNAILNSARQYYDPPVEIDDSRPVLSVTRNEGGFNPGLAIEFQDAINSDTFLGFSPGTVKVAKIAAQSQFENNWFYWRVTYEFNFRREGWNISILDQGRYELRNGKPVPIREFDTSGVEIPFSHVTDPVPLNGAGLRLPNPSPDTVIYGTYQVYRERDFSFLNL